MIDGTIEEFPLVRTTVLCSPKPMIVYRIFVSNAFFLNITLLAGVRGEWRSMGDGVI